MQRQMGIKSAYGQLILLVFLPITILAGVGAVLVFSETKRAVKNEQDALAQAAIIRYAPLVEPLLKNIAKNNTTDDEVDDNTATPTTWDKPSINQSPSKRTPSSKQIQNDIQLSVLIATTDTGVLSSSINPNQTARSVDGNIQPQQHVQRVAVFDADGKLLASVGAGGNHEWQAFDTTKNSIWRLPSTETEGMIYGVRLNENSKGDNASHRYVWLVVDMDNEPLTIAYYRILIALAITGLMTILLLLLSLTVYSKRWIAPIYEMRLYLQGMSADKLDRASSVRADGEFKLLQLELSRTMKRLKSSFDELKKHSDETESDLQQALDEMEMQAISVRQAHAMAVSSNEAKSAFLATVSHELRTPLNSIDGFINLLARGGKLDDKQAIYVQTIQKSSAHLLALINEVLDFSKIEAGKLVLERYELNLYDLVYEVADMLTPTAQEKNLRMAVLFYHDVPTMITGDGLRLKQVLTNLLGNAIKFTDSGEVLIIVSLNEKNAKEYIRISVQDSGKGVDKDSEHELFQSFSQGDLSITRRYGGTGLGLVISKELVGLMGGEIGYLDNLTHDIASRGATFWFSLPLDDEMGGTVFDEFDGRDDNLMMADGEILAWLSHPPSRQVLQASLAQTGVKLTIANSLANLLQKLEEKSWQWVIADSFGQDGDVTALLRQIRLHYGGRLWLFGYEIGFDRALLSDYHAEILREPLDRRELYAMLSNQRHTSLTPQKRWQGMTVLIVDDHEPNLLVLEALLNEQGIDVLTADSGFSAIEMVTSAHVTGEQIEMIFMDIQMPRMSGFETSREIRKLEKAHHSKRVPIVALTAHASFDDVAELTKAGIDDYASKPMGQAVLVQLLQKWLSYQQDKVHNGDSHDANASDVTTDLSLINDHKSLPNQATFSKISHQNLNPSPSDNDKSDDNLGDKLDDSLTANTDTPADTLENDTILDWTDALTRSGDKPELAVRLLTMLVNDIENQKQSLERAWAERNRAALADISHKIVGGTRYTGVPRLRWCAESFEKICRADVVAVSASHFINMRPSYRRLIDALDELQAVDLDSYLANHIRDDK